MDGDTDGFKEEAGMEEGEIDTLGLVDEVGMAEAVGDAVGAPHVGTSQSSMRHMLHNTMGHQSRCMGCGRNFLLDQHWDKFPS